MTSERFRRLQDLFHSALNYEPGAERDRFVTEQCGGDEELLAVAADLIRADGEREGGAPGLPAFGVFQAERVLGRGGMGVVYLAHRTDGQFEQRAAVKVIQAGQMATPGYDS